MRTQRGTYDGASEFAYFDKDIREMTERECRDLLQCILYQAMPGSSDAAEIVFRELAIAEENMRQWMGQWSTPRRQPKTQPV